MKNNVSKSIALPRLPKFKWFWKYNEKDKAYPDLSLLHKF